MEPSDRLTCADLKKHEYFDGFKEPFEAELHVCTFYLLLFYCSTFINHNTCFYFIIQCWRQWWCHYCTSMLFKINLTKFEINFETKFFANRDFLNYIICHQILAELSVYPFLHYRLWEHTRIQNRKEQLDTR